MLRAISGTVLPRLGAIAAAAAISLWSAMPASAQSWDQIVAAAKKEGRVVFYTSLVQNGVEQLIEKFNETYPEIEVEFIRLGSNPLIERFATEFNAGRHLADVMSTAPDERLFQGAKDGWMAKWTPPEIGNFPASANYQDMMFTIVQTREALIYNKNLVPEGERPTTWNDLFNPKWKGKVGMNPPWRSVTMQAIVALWEDQGIKDPAQKMKDNNVRFFEGSAGVVQAVIRGDVAVAELGDLPLNEVLARGAPIGFIYPKEGTIYSDNVAFAAAKAPHPNAAKVFVNWMLTANGQVDLQNCCGLPGVRNGVPPMSHIPPTAQINAKNGLDLLTPERQKKIVTEWRQMFGVM